MTCGDFSRAQLHSRYNPQAEAARYVDSLNIKENTECFILIEPGLGYIVPVLRQRFLNSRIIALHIEHDAAQNTLYNQFEVLSLRCADPPVIQDFLDKNIPRISIEKIRVIEWRPSLNHYKEKYLKLFSQTADFLKRADAEKRTEAAFGRRWVKNFFRNIGNIKKNILFKQTEIPVIITGSGPCLENALPVIKKTQDFCLIIAASSSVMALSHAGIKADIVICTDGGPWALRHIYPAIRNHLLCESGAGNSGALAVNLCACLPSQCSASPQLVINDGSFWQSIALHALSIPSVIIPSKGTVTATAAELAMILSSGSVYLAGMDFSVDDIRTHVKPYGFDYLFFSGANRFLPVYSQIFTRSSLLKQGGSMDIYASWFKNQLVSWPKKIFSIGKSRVFEEGNPLDQLNFKNRKIDKGIFKTVSIKDDPAASGEKAVKALLAAMKKSEYSESLKQELGSLLGAQEDIEAALNEIAFSKQTGVFNV